MKLIIKMVALLGFVLASLNVQSTTLRTCNNCSDYRMKATAEAGMKQETAIVLDNVRGELKMYEVRRFVVDDFIWEFRATEITSSIELQDAYQKFFDKKQEFDDDFLAALGADGKLDYGSLIGADDTINAIDWFSNSSHKRQTYGVIANNFPSMIAAMSAWDDMLSNVDVTVVVAEIDLGGFNSQFILQLADGTELLVKLDHKAKSVEYNRAWDQSGAEIPLPTATNIYGTYAVPNLEYFSALAAYFNGRFAASTAGTFPSNKSGKTCSFVCEDTSETTPKCVLRCK